MKKIIINTEMVNAMAEEEIRRTHERKAKSTLIQQRVKELIAEGIDKELAKVMAKVEYEYNI